MKILKYIIYSGDISLVSMLDHASYGSHYPTPALNKTSSFVSLTAGRKHFPVYWFHLCKKVGGLDSDRDFFLGIKTVFTSLNKPEQLYIPTVLKNIFLFSFSFQMNYSQ